MSENISKYMNIEKFYLSKICNFSVFTTKALVLFHDRHITIQHNNYISGDKKHAINFKKFFILIKHAIYQHIHK